MNMLLNVLRYGRNNACLFCNAVADLRQLFVEFKVDVSIKCDIFFPELNRSCNIHLDARGFILTPLLTGMYEPTVCC